MLPISAGRIVPAGDTKSGWFALAGIVGNIRRSDHA
jgi:hypothetical protein